MTDPLAAGIAAATATVDAVAHRDAQHRHAVHELVTDACGRASLRVTNALGRVPGLLAEGAHDGVDDPLRDRLDRVAEAVGETMERR